MALWLIALTGALVINLLPAREVGAQMTSAAKRKGASRAEVLMLPQFCWSRYISDLQGPEYSIPQSCGAWTNHYCGGLLALQRVKTGKVGGKERAINLQSARATVEYTYRGINKSASCPIVEHVESSLLEVNALLGNSGKVAP